MTRALIGNGGHAKEVIAQMGEILFRFVDDQYDEKNHDPYVLPLSSFNPSEFPGIRRDWSLDVLVKIQSPKSPDNIRLGYCVNL